jgi:hypothetical protein
MREADGRSARRSVHAEARFRSSSVLEESANHPGRYGLVDAIDCATRHAAEFTTDYTIFGHLESRRVRKGKQRARSRSGDRQAGPSGAGSHDRDSSPARHGRDVCVSTEVPDVVA